MRSLLNVMLTLTASLLIALSPTTSAHSLGQSYLYLDISENGIGLRFEVIAADINRATGLDLPTDGTLTQAQVETNAERIATYLLEHVSVAPDGTPATPVFVRHGLRGIELGQFVLSEFRIDGLGAAPTSVDFRYDVLLDEVSDHSGVLVIENDWRSHTFENEASISLIFDAGKREQTLDLTESTLLRGTLAMIELGAHHILIGADHIMFLIALLLPSVARREAGRWQPVESLPAAAWYVLKIVTVFTIAHSITLSLAALDTFSLSPRIVESMIALSIILAAIDIFVPIFGRRIVAVVFAFGLFHGAGFASVLLSMKIHADYTVLTLLGFNVGVELGQIAIVALAFPLLYLVRARAFYLRGAMQAVAAALIVVAAYWFIERAFEIDLPAGEIVQNLLGVKF